ncbi:MAG: LysR substrate-binding domain-containing protein [Chloroflexota bacterium]
MEYNFSFSLTQLKYIVAVDQHQHFSKAAKACFVSQPSLSMQIQKLEEHLGIAIFDREKNPIQTTDIGKLVVQQARVILREAAGIETLVNHANDLYIGELRIGILPTLGPYILPLVAKSFTKKYPQIAIRVHELTTANIIDQIKNDQLDAGIIATDETKEKLLTSYLFEEKFINFISSTYHLAAKQAIKREDLNLDDMWLLNEGHCFRDQVLNVCRTAPDMNIALGARQPYFDSGYFETLIRLVENAGGMTLLPELAMLFLTDEQQRLIRPFDGEAPGRLVRLIQPKSFLKQHLIQAFVDVLKAQLKPHLETVYP